MMFNKIRLLLPLLPRLGFANVANVAGYRLALASGLIGKMMPAGDGYHNPLFHGPCHLTKDLFCPVLESDVVDLAEAQLKGDISYFSDQPYNVGSPPDWFLNPVNQKRYPDSDLHWSRLPDFSDEAGDIKIIWEASRFDWALIFATSTPLTAGIPGIAARVFRQKPFVFEVRDLWPELPREMGVIRNPLVLGAMDLLEWLSYHCAKGCIGLSPGIVDGIKRRGIASENVIMIPNGCDLELFRTKESGRTGKEFKAIFTGAHGIANGLDAVLDAAEELKKRGREDIKILFIGDGKLKPALKERAVAESLDNCLFLDPIPKDKMPDLLQQVDAGMMILENVPAFYYGTSPNKFFDYIASGLPVINNYPGWLAGMITENRCGIAVPPEDPEAFANALEYMADHPEEVAEMGKNARILAEGNFDRIQLAERFVDWLEQSAKE